MIKTLKGALGKIVAERAKPTLGVVGHVEWLPESRNTVLEIGALDGDGSWAKVKDAGRVALTPDEREELIEVLESHRDYQYIKVGDIVGVGFTVIAVQYVNTGSDGRELRGTVLAYNDNKREWGVWTTSPQDDLAHGTNTFDGHRALNAFSVRTTEHLYLKFNTSPPVLTFGHVTERDKLGTDA